MLKLSKKLNMTPNELAKSYFNAQKGNEELLKSAQDYQVATINYLTNSSKESLYHVDPNAIVSTETFNQIMLEHRKYLQASSGRVKISFVQKKNTE